MNKRKFIKKALKNSFENFWGNRGGITIRIPEDKITDEQVLGLMNSCYWIKDTWTFKENRYVYIVYYEKRKYLHHTVKSLINEGSVKDGLKGISHKFFPKIVLTNKEVTRLF